MASMINHLSLGICVYQALHVAPYSISQLLPLISQEYHMYTMISCTYFTVSIDVYLKLHTSTVWASANNYVAHGTEAVETCSDTHIRAPSLQPWLANTVWYKLDLRSGSESGQTNAWSSVKRTVAVASPPWPLHIATYTITMHDCIQLKANMLGIGYSIALWVLIEHWSAKIWDRHILGDCS